MRISRSSANRSPKRSARAERSGAARVSRGRVAGRFGERPEGRFASRARKGKPLSFMPICVLLAIVLAFSASVAYADEASSSASSSKKASVPEATDPFEDAVTLDADDGLYTVEVKLEGGSGKASVTSPAELEVFDGRGAITLVWSSPHYDYMIVKGKKYLPTNKTGNSSFIVPVAAYDKPMEVVGDTTAMGEPHEIRYELTVRKSSMKSTIADESADQGSPAEDGASSGAAEATVEKQLPWPWLFFIVCAVLSAVALGVTVGLLRNYRN